MKSTTKIPSRTVDDGYEKVRLSAIENSLNLQFPLRYEYRDRKVGAFVLGKGTRTDRLKFVFGFECKGIHSTLKQREVNEAFNAIESGLKDMPARESLTIHFGSFTSDTDRQAQLSQLSEMAPSRELQFLIFGQKQRIQELTKQGIRKPKFLRIYVTYTIDPDAAGANDQIEKTLAKFSTYWHQFTGQQQEVETQKFETMFAKAFTDGFQIWEQLLSTKMKLDLTPMTEVNLWQHTWSRFNKSKAPELPQTVIFSESGITEEINSEVHPTTMLIETLKDCPEADREWVHARGKYIGALTFQDKPAGWASKWDQLRYLWDIFSRDRVFDTEVCCEFSRANEAIVKENMSRLTKQAIVAADFSASKKNVDVAAAIKTRRAVAAQEQLYTGDIPLNTGVAILVHRSTPELLDEACRYIQSCIRRPAWLDRETEYAWLLWLQTIRPLVWDQLLSTPFNRRMLFLSSEVPGFMSLVLPRQCDRKGFELLSEEGGSPILLDFFAPQPKNLAIFATTRGGKSVLISDILTQALAHSMPIVALDFPKPDGTSTFTDYTYFMKDIGAYFDIGAESNNLFEIPDLRKLSLKEQVERMKDYKSFLEGALLTMIFGGASASGSADMVLLRSAIRAMIVPLLEQFFNDEEIKRRYDTAIEGGFGSEAWQVMPTLHDFLKLCRLERLDVAEPSDTDRRAMSQIQLQVKFWVTSSVGQAISAPSSFRTDSPLLVFALRNLADDSDAAVLALSAYSAALRRALASPASVFFIDESPILFQFDEIAALVAKLCANGAKAGIRTFLSAQDPDTIAKSPSASKILQNLQTKLIGRIQPVAVKSFVQHLNLPEEIISRNATEAFFPRREGIYSQWLLEDSGYYTFCRFYANYPQLAAVVNNTDEQRARNLWMNHYNDPFVGLAKFSQELVSSMRDNRPLRGPDGKPV